MKARILLILGFLFVTTVPLGAQVLWVGSCADCYTTLYAATQAVTSYSPTNSAVIYVSANYVDTVTQTVVIGSGAGAHTKVIMLPGSHETIAITNGTPGIILGDGSTLECVGGAFSGNVNSNQYQSSCNVDAAPGMNVSIMIGGAHILNGNFQDSFSLQGITVNYNNGTVTGGGAVDIAAIGAPSLFANNSFLTGPNVTASTCIVHYHNAAGGGVVFLDNQIRNSGAMNVTPLCITGEDATGFQGVTGETKFEGGEISCPGNNRPVIKIDGNAGGSGFSGVAQVWFEGFHSQYCSWSGFTPTPATSYITINNAVGVHFQNLELTPGGSTNVVAISESAIGKTQNIMFDNVGIGCPSDTAGCPGYNFIADSTNGGTNHPFPTNIITAPSYGYVANVIHDEAAMHLDGKQGYSRLHLSCTTASAFTYPDACLSINGQSAAYSAGGDNEIVRINAGGANSLLFGVNGYSDTWIQSVQDDTSNYPKPLQLNPGGGTVSIGSNYVPLQSTGTQTGGYLACIKSAGPPIIIGTCTAVSGATCTACN
jgi:hypothetical protein